MINVFLLIPDLASGPEATTARLLALHSSRQRFSISIGVLGSANGPVADELRAADVPVYSVPIRHSLDLKGVRQLRRAIRESAPTVLHIFGPDTARAARLIVDTQGETGNIPRLAVSSAASPTGGLGGWFAARLIRRADRVIPMTWADGERYRRLGVPAERLTRICPAAPELAVETNREATLKLMGMPSDSRFILTDGQLERGSGPKDAVVAFDMLRYEARDLHLAVFGAGVGTSTLEQFGRALAFDDFRIHFPDPSENSFRAEFPLTPVSRAVAVRQATVVWVTAPHGGTDEVLEAMAASKPVVAWATPDLTEIIDDGVTGFLVPVGDKAMLAAKARLLIDDPDLAAWMGKGARTRAMERFPIGRMIEQFGRVYTELAES
ncbi:MAG: glycosyltransferase family 4 protein [Planctomycetes bacterium]|nr:glycosyltransferase family 4 protein [Planctomycetota bacterium]